MWVFLAIIRAHFLSNMSLVFPASLDRSWEILKGEKEMKRHNWLPLDARGRNASFEKKTKMENLNSNLRSSLIHFMEAI